MRAGDLTQVKAARRRRGYRPGVDAASPEPAATGVVVLYGSTTGATEDAAERIAARLGAALGGAVPCLDVGAVDAASLHAFDAWVVGTSTWNVGELQADWDARIDELAALDLRGTWAAFFGTGDAAIYGDTFGDAVGIVAERLEAAGARRVGSWPLDGYAFEASRAQRGDALVGLLLDYDNDAEGVGPRIDAWCRRLAVELRSRTAPVTVE